jgi:hypothetical protein
MLGIQLQLVNGLQGVYSWSPDAAVQDVSQHLHPFPVTSDARLVQPLVSDVLHVSCRQRHSQGIA